MGFFKLGKQAVITIGAATYGDWWYGDLVVDGKNKGVKTGTEAQVRAWAESVQEHTARRVQSIELVVVEGSYR